MMMSGLTIDVNLTGSPSLGTLGQYSLLTGILVSLERLNWRRHVVAVPPAAAERLEQRGGVGEALRSRLDQRESGGLVGLLGGQHLQITGAAGLVLRLHEIRDCPRRSARPSFCAARASASPWSASRASATFWKAVSTVDL